MPNARCWSCAIPKADAAGARPSNRASTCGFEGLQSRAATAERLLSEARQNLVVRTEEVRAFDRKAVEATIARNNAEKRLAQAEGMHEMRENHIKDVEKARAALAEHTDATTKTLKAREAVALDEPPIAPDEPSNDEAIIKAQADKNAESA